MLVTIFMVVVLAVAEVVAATVVLRSPHILYFCILSTAFALARFPNAYLHFLNDPLEIMSSSQKVLRFCQLGHLWMVNVTLSPSHPSGRASPYSLHYKGSP